MGARHILAVEARRDGVCDKLTIVRRDGNTDPVELHQVLLALSGGRWLAGYPYPRPEITIMDGPHLIQPGAVAFLRHGSVIVVARQGFLNSVTETTLTVTGLQ